MSLKTTAPDFELHFLYPCAGYITYQGEDTGAFLQDEDYYSLAEVSERLASLD